MSKLTWATYTSVDDFDTNSYTNLLEHSDTASIHHHPGWLGAIEKGLNKEPRHIVVEDSGNPVGVLPNFLHSLDPLPFDRLVSVNPGRGGPVLSSSWEPVLDSIFKALAELLDSRVVEHTIRIDVTDLLGISEYVSEAGYDVTVGGKFVLSLDTDWDGVQAGMHKDRRYDLRKATETEHEVRELELTDSNLSEFYADYCQKMDELGTQTLPRQFFAELTTRLEDRLVLLTNLADGKRRGYHLYLIDDYQSTIRHYLMTVTRDDYKYYSGELMHKHMIKRGLSDGWNRYDFGGRDVDFRDGGFNYKSQYGGELVGTYRWKLQTSRIIQFIRRTARNLR